MAKSAEVAFDFLTIEEACSILKMGSKEELYKFVMKFSGMELKLES